MKHYKITLGTGLAWTQSYTVEATNEAETTAFMCNLSTLRRYKMGIDYELKYAMYKHITDGKKQVAQHEN